VIVPDRLVLAVDASMTEEERRARLRESLEARRKARQQLKERRGRTDGGAGLLAQLVRHDIAQETSVLLQALHHLSDRGQL
jgi:hypothetical protein